MLQSNLFSKTTKNLPEGETTKNAQLLLKGGFIRKSSAGVFSLLPLGLRVLNKINQIIREEMNAIGGEELLMPALIHKKYWEQANRWDTDVIYKTGAVVNQRVVREDFEYGLGWTHEEVITDIATHFLQSYKDLPKAVYQIQTKFRAELRAQAGLLRGREFMMKDLYSFHTDTDDLNNYYQKVIKAYKNIFKRVGVKTIVTEASGGTFTKEYTHEFQMLNPAGEDTIHYCGQCDFSQNTEVFSAAHHQGCSGTLATGKAIELANVFKLGTRFSEAFNLNYADQKGVKKPVVMGSYGIGPTRLIGALVEAYSDQNGILWPSSVAPFTAHVVALGDAPKVKAEAQKVYKLLVGQAGADAVLYDQRAVSPGEKLRDSDLIGIPLRIVVSEKTIAQKKVEIKKRSEQQAKLVSLTSIKKALSLTQQG